jgi:hypothetical protein
VDAKGDKDSDETLVGASFGLMTRARLVFLLERTWARHETWPDAGREQALAVMTLARLLVPTRALSLALVDGEEGYCRGAADSFGGATVGLMRERKKSAPALIGTLEAWGGGSEVLVPEVTPITTAPIARMAKHPLSALAEFGVLLAAHMRRASAAAAVLKKLGMPFYIIPGQ